MSRMIRDLANLNALNVQVIIVYQCIGGQAEVSSKFQTFFLLLIVINVTYSILHTYFFLANFPSSIITNFSS